MADKKTLKVTLVKSPIGFNEKQGRVVQSMGLRRIRHSVELTDTPESARHDPQGAPPGGGGGIGRFGSAELVGRFEHRASLT